MTTTELTFPTQAQLAAALESLLDTAQRTYDQCDRSDKEERAFWRRQRNAYINAQADVLAGRLPLVAGDAYLVSSASRPGAYHRCWREGGVWRCSCTAGDLGGENGAFHRHTALISAIEYAIDLIEQELVGEGDPIEDDDPHGPITVTPAPLGLRLSRGDEDAIECHAPADVAAAIEALVTRPAALGQRLAQARARLAA